MEFVPAHAVWEKGEIVNDWKTSKLTELIATILVVLVALVAGKAIGKQGDSRPQISDAQEVGIQKLQSNLDSLEVLRTSITDLSRTDICTVRELYIKYKGVRDEYNALNLPLYAFLTRNIHADTHMLAEVFYSLVFESILGDRPIICNPGYENQVLEDADDAMKEYLPRGEYERRHPAVRQAFIKVMAPSVEQALAQYVNLPFMPREDLRRDFVGWVNTLTARWGGTAEDFGVPPMLWEQISK